MTPEGVVEIRVDHVSDIVSVNPFSDKVPLKWRCSQSEATTSADTWKVRGKDFYKQTKFQFAVECISNGLQRSPTDNEIRSIIYARGLAFFRMGNFEAALSDFEHPLVATQPSGVYLSRKADILYNLGRYRECCEIHKTISEKFPKTENAKAKRAEAICRVLEQEKGRYRFGKMQRDAPKLFPPMMNVATYAAPVAIKTGPHGKGLYTTTAVKAGDLLLCEKALAFGYFSHGSHSISILIDPVTESIGMGKQVEVIDILVRKVQNNPALLPVFTDLYHGSYESTDVKMVDGEPIVDTFVAERIAALNAFTCPLSNLERQNQIIQAKYHNKHVKESEFASCGIWTKASYINHSCYNNARRSFIGDMMILRASQDLEANTEITMWYKPPLKNDKQHPTGFKHWGFECKCALCEGFKATEPNTLTKRKTLTESLWEAFEKYKSADIARIEKYIKVLEKTYTQPATTLPRLCIWDPCLALSQTYESQMKPVKAIEWGLKGMEALGFIIEGGAVPRSSEAPLLIKHWGMMEDELIGPWLVLSRAYRTVAPCLEAAAMGYAKTCYRICVGEAETFEQTYAFALK